MKLTSILSMMFVLFFFVPLYAQYDQTETTTISCALSAKYNSSIYPGLTIGIEQSLAEESFDLGVIAGIFFIENGNIQLTVSPVFSYNFFNKNELMIYAGLAPEIGLITNRETARMKSAIRTHVGIEKHLKKKNIYTPLITFMEIGPVLNLEGSHRVDVFLSLGVKYCMKYERYFHLKPVPQYEPKSPRIKYGKWWQINRYYQ